MIVSKHAEKRMRKRLNIPRSAIYKVAYNAMIKGKSRDKQSDARLRKYISWKLGCSPKGSLIKVYANYIYVFRNDVLVTMFALPGRLTK